MKLSKRGQYATRAMLQLALKEDKGPMSLREIAESENISEQYLEQIFRDLRKAGLVQSIRGAHGGYQLANKLEDISVGDILVAVEGPIVPVDCLARRSSCERAEGCTTRAVWLALQQSILEVLNQNSLADMVKLTKKEAN